MNFVETGLTIRVGPLLPDTTDYDCKLQSTPLWMDPFC